MQSIRKPMNVGGNFLDTLLKFMNLFTQGARILCLDAKLFQRDRQQGHALVQVVMKLTRDATALFLLGGDQATAEIAQDFLDSLLLSDVDHEAIDADHPACSTSDAHQVVNPNDGSITGQHAKCEIETIGNSRLRCANFYDAVAIIGVDVRDQKIGCVPACN